MSGTLRTEYQILKELSTVILTVIKPLEFIASSNLECIVLEDFGGVSFRNVVQSSGPFYKRIAEFIEIAIQITDTLRTLSNYSVFKQI